MLRARQHCCNRYGWLFCKPEHYQEAFDEQMRLVNTALSTDPAFSGEPEDLEPWASQQLRTLASDPWYARQISAHVGELETKALATAQQLERTAAELSAKVDALEAERQHLLSFLADE